MSIVPVTFSEENEGYITLSAFKKFARDKKNYSLRTTASRPEMVEDINQYAESSEENKKTVLLWVDSVLKEGIKDLYVKKMDLNNDQLSKLNDDSYVCELLEEEIYDPNCRYLCNHYTGSLHCYRYEINNTIDGRVINIYLGKLITFSDKNNGTRSNPYPLFVDIYVDKGIIVGRAKSKSNMYKYTKFFDSEHVQTTSTEKEILNAIKYTLEIFGIATIKGYLVSEEFKGMLYNMLLNYTQTPTKIVQMMEDKKAEVEEMRDLLVNRICGLSTYYLNDVLSDITNMVEKYFSISYPDKSIFTADREAYPLKISATDDEESKLEQRAANEDPLQSKAIFFDNKKLLQKSQLCDGVWFRFLRQSSIYFNKAFNVRISIKNDCCSIKFTEFTLEEDIRHVLFSLIKS
ncbi:MAG: hypothetical protein F8N38_01160 [Hungatella sp.]|nr:hypothetical protein [Hungatella sp.]